jgi:hypothetical protein
VGRKDDGRALRHLVQLLDEDGTALLQRLHHVLVVHDLLADIDRRTVQIERLLHRDHRAVDPGAVAAGRRQQDPLLLGPGSLGRGTDGRVGRRGHARESSCADLGPPRHRQ